MSSTVKTPSSPAASSDTLRFYETQHTQKFPWDLVSVGYWVRYPNEHSSHVFSVDTLETKIVDGKLYCRRLIMKTNPLPSWGKHFFAARRVPVIEECLVDPHKRTHTWYTRNIGLTRFMATVEKACLFPCPQDPDNTTLVRKQTWIGSSILGFRTAIRKFGIDRYKKNCVLATTGFDSVLTRLQERQVSPTSNTSDNVADSPTKSGYSSNKITESAALAPKTVIHERVNVFNGGGGEFITSGGRRSCHV